MDSLGIRNPQAVFLHDSVRVSIQPRPAPTKKRSVPRAALSSELRFHIPPEGVPRSRSPLRLASTIGVLI